MARLVVAAASSGKISWIFLAIVEALGCRTLAARRRLELVVVVGSKLAQLEGPGSLGPSRRWFVEPRKVLERKLAL